MKAASSTKIMVTRSRRRQKDGFVCCFLGMKYLDVPDGLTSASSVLGDDSVGTAPDSSSSSSAAASFGCHSCCLLLPPSAFSKQTNKQFLVKFIHPFHIHFHTGELVWNESQMQNPVRILFFSNMSGIFVFDLGGTGNVEFQDSDFENNRAGRQRKPRTAETLTCIISGGSDDHLFIRQPRRFRGDSCRDQTSTTITIRFSRKEGEKQACASGNG